MSDQRTYTIKRQVETYDCLFNEDISPVSLLLWFQEIAQMHSESLELGFTHMDALGLGWIVTRYEMEFVKLPRYGEELILETRSIGFRGFSAYRSFDLRNLEGELLVHCLSEWMLLDRENQKVLRPESVKELEVLNGRERAHFSLRRLASLGEVQPTKSYQARITDIDHNQHVNNSVYLTWALDTLPPEILRDKKIARINIVFKNQAFYAEPITTLLDVVDEDYLRVDILRGDTLLCQVQFEMKE